MDPFRTLTAIAAPLPMPNVDTDQIIPARFLRAGRDGGFGRACLHDVRFGPDGEPRADLPLNHPAVQGAQILVSGPNFGCGSSREEAVYALWDFGIRAVIAPGFGDIFYGNALKNGMVPVVLPEPEVAELTARLQAAPGSRLTVDLDARTVSDEDGVARPFAITEFARRRLLEGLDELDHT
ncbi:3-isopropylmalate dehydratase small subunit [Thermocatellispora tengchongensis]